MEYFNLFCIFILFIQGSILLFSIDNVKSETKNNPDELYKLKKDIELVAKNPNLARRKFKQRNDNV